MTNEEAWIDLCEKNDRSSPEGHPDMALITQEELYDYLDTVRQRERARKAEAQVDRRSIQYTRNERGEIVIDGITFKHYDDPDGNGR